MKHQYKFPILFCKNFILVKKDMPNERINSFTLSLSNLGLATESVRNLPTSRY